MIEITVTEGDLFAWSPAATPAAPKAKRTIAKEITRSVTGDMETLVVDATGLEEKVTLTKFNEL